MRELITPTLGEEITGPAPNMLAGKKPVANTARSRYLEATNASSAHQLPRIPWTKRESRWGPRYVLRKPSDLYAPNADEVEPMATDGVPCVDPQAVETAVAPVEVSTEKAPENGEAVEKESVASGSEVVAGATKPSMMTPEESSKETPKESISTSPEKGLSLLPKKEEKEKEEKTETESPLLLFLLMV